MPRRKIKLLVAPGEWDFRSVREEELMTACLYKYTRSCPSLRAKIEAWHAQPLVLEKLAGMDFDNG